MLRRPPGAVRDRRPLLLAYRALGLGDLLTAVPALRALARAFPDHRRVLCTPSALAPLAELAGAVDAVAGTAALAEPSDACRSADVAINLHGRGPQSHRALLATRPGRLIAFACPEAGHGDGPPWRAGVHERERWCHLLEAAGIPCDPLDLELRDVPEPPMPDLTDATLIHPGAASEARRWPAERFAEVARSERERGRRVLVTGSAAERDLARSVADQAGLGEDAVLAGRTSLLELTATVAAAGRLVSGDTGVAHVATAVGTPSVLLFGPVDPAEWGPPSGRPRHRVLWSGRQGDPHARTPDPGLLQIEVADVVRALRRLPEGLPVPAREVVSEPAARVRRRQGSRDDP